MNAICPTLRAAHDAHDANRAAIDAAKREAVAKRIAEQRAVVDAEQADRKPWVNDFWRFRTGPDVEGVDDPVFGPNSHTYWGR